MTREEKTLNFWREANGLPKATAFDLQSARACEVAPVFCGQNKWTCDSTSRANVTYTQEVYFVGFSDASDIGFEIEIKCSCPASGVCKHQIAIETKYHSNWKYYFSLFGLPEDARFSELHKKADEVYLRLCANSRKLAA